VQAIGPTIPLAYIELQSEKSTNLMAELVVVLGELPIGDPHRNTLIFRAHLAIDLLASDIIEPVRRCSECADQQLLLEPVFHALDGVVQTTVGVRVRLDVPRLSTRGVRGPGCADGCFALESRRPVVGKGRRSG
jgi:hypothetical protein